MNKLFLLSIRNLRRNVKRNLATGSAIAFGFAGIIMLIAYTFRVENYLRTYTVYITHIGHLKIYQKSGFEKFQYKPAKFSLSPDDQEIISSFLKTSPEVEFFESQIRGSGLVGNGCMSFPFSGEGIDPSIDQKVFEHPEVSRWLQNFKFILKGNPLWQADENLGAIQLSKTLSNALGKFNVWSDLPPDSNVLVPCENIINKEIFSGDANVQLLASSFDGAMNAVDGEMVSHFSTGFRETDTSALRTSVSKLQELFSTKNVSNYSIYLKNIDDLEIFKEKLKNHFKSLNKEFDIHKWSEEEISPYYVGTIEFLKTIITFVAIILTLIITFSVLNSTTMTVLERSNEIGMYRSQGFRKSHVTKLFVLETIWLSAIGLFAGFVLGISGVTIVNKMNIMYHPPGVIDGLQLVLIPNHLTAFYVGSSILIITAIVAHFALLHNLRLNIVTLIGGVKR